MKKSLWIVALLSVCGALPACSKSKLTDDQKNAFSQTLESAGRVQNAVPKGGAASPQAEISGSSSELDQAHMKSVLQEKMQSKECDIVTKTPEMGSPSSSSSQMNMDFGLKVSGTNCPIALDMTIQAVMSSSGATMHTHCAYRVLDSQYLTLNDVDSMSLDGGMEAKPDGNSKISMSADLKGNIHSQKRGDVKVTMTGSGKMDQDGGDSELTTRFEFSDFTAELQQKTSGQETKYYLNDEEISKSEYDSWLSKGGMLFSSTTTSQGTQSTVH